MPLCYIRNLLVSAKKVAAVPEIEKYETGVRRTPLMGWSSWNTFRNHIDEDLILETAEAMKEKGLLDAGYSYVNLDDCWQSNVRDENGDLQGDLATFPSGIKPLVEKINAMGFKLGLYSSNRTLTCGGLPGFFRQGTSGRPNACRVGRGIFQIRLLPQHAAFFLRASYMGGNCNRKRRKARAEVSLLQRRFGRFGKKTSLYISPFGRGKVALFGKNNIPLIQVVEINEKE